MQKALASGRIRADADGKIDSDVADQSWSATTDEGHRRNPEQEKAKASSPVHDREPPARHDPPPTSGGLSLAQATAVEKAYKARIARIDYEERSGKLVPTDEVKAEWLRIVSAAKNKVLGLPNKIKSRVPSLTLAEVAAIDAMVRETLEDLADPEAETLQ